MSLKSFLTKLFGKVKVEETRTIVINNREKNRVHKFSENFVRTTRYRWWDFIPKNLLEQFHRLANIYFLIISALQVFTDLSPTGSYTTIGPLLLILTVSAIKEAIEDFARYRSDVETNNRKLFLLNDKGEWETVTWKEIETGDIVKIVNRQYFPADICLIATSEPLGMAYIETSNLDGETNLKIRQSLLETNEFVCDPKKITELGSLSENFDDSNIKKFEGVIGCEAPNNRLNTFDGYLEFQGKKFSLTSQQILLRGAQLRQTKWAIGSVVFAGYDTKVVRNSSKAPSKRSNIERRTNYFIVVILFLLVSLCILSSAIQVISVYTTVDQSWYLPKTSGQLFAQTFATYLILLSTMVPISLYVTLEVVKMCQAFHINWDLGMYDDESDKYALTRSSGLNEELGQVEYIFSDKTGTLTQNLMEFRKCSVGMVKYGRGTTEIGRAAAFRSGITILDDTDPKWKKPDPMFNFQDQSFIQALRDPKHPDQKIIREFVTLLAVCHTVVPEGQGDSLIYQAASPDEAALVAAAKCFNFKFHTRTPKSITVSIDGVDKVFQILNVLEFNADRKRMSVVIRNPEGKIVLYTKGADTLIMERLAKGQKTVEATKKILEDFATEGLRTLCCAMKKVDESYWKEWNVRFQKAATSLSNRQAMLDAAAEEIETDMTLVGTTAIEDKLQQGVPDCISTLAKANIKIWVLTGDKQETAINIGFACALLDNDMTLFILNEPNLELAKATLKKAFLAHEKLNDAQKKRCAIIADGPTLRFILENKEMKMAFLKLGKLCKAVVCCRVTPGQKAEVTRLVKDNENKICLAIGDGANDVAMIQAAHVGIGISGKEGLQAVQSSDYAIAQFRFLKKLLLVHGHWNYRRVGRVITFNFYKNICLYMTQYWFGIYNLYSGQSLYESWTQSAFNLFFTSLPIIAYGILDQDVSERGLYAFPQIYSIGQNKLLFNPRTFRDWLSNALVHSAVCFLIPLFVNISITTRDGQEGGLFGMGAYVYTAIVFLCSGKVFLMTRTHNKISILSIVLSIFAWFLWLLIYSLVILSSQDLTVWKLGYFVLPSPSWWLTAILLAPFFALLRDFAWRSYKDIHRNLPVVEARKVEKENRWDEVEQKAKAQDQADAKAALAASSTSPLKSPKSSGYAFAGGVSNDKGKTDWEQRLDVVSVEEMRKLSRSNPTLDVQKSNPTTNGQAQKKDIEEQEEEDKKRDERERERQKKGVSSSSKYKDDEKDREKHKHHSHDDKDKDRDRKRKRDEKDKEREKEKDKDKDRERERDKSRGKEKEKEKEKERHRDKDRERDKDKERSKEKHREKESEKDIDKSKRQQTIGEIEMGNVSKKSVN